MGAAGERTLLKTLPIAFISVESPICVPVPKIICQRAFNIRMNLEAASHHGPPRSVWTQTLGYSFCTPAG